MAEMTLMAALVASCGKDEAPSAFENSINLSDRLFSFSPENNSVIPAFSDIQHSNISFLNYQSFEDYTKNPGENAHFQLFGRLEDGTSVYLKDGVLTNVPSTWPAPHFEEGRLNTSYIFAMHAALVSLENVNPHTLPEGSWTMVLQYGSKQGITNFHTK